VKIVLGLGNPGKKYSGTRHNVGFLVVDHIAEENHIAVTKRKCHSLVGEWSTDGDKVILAKPQTYMNGSGQAAESFLNEFSLSSDGLVVIHDDLDLPFGSIRIRPTGGPGGHRGVLSILESLGEERFFRVRVGIGRPPPGVDPSNFVLEPFTAREAGELDAVVSRASHAVACLLVEGPRRAMAQFNRPNRPEAPL
jgi:peptidyl-tRNA hydrolase, PTH1 family